jgi:hypothetical protein
MYFSPSSVLAFAQAATNRVREVNAPGNDCGQYRRLLGPAERADLYIARKGKMVPKLWLLDWNGLFKVQEGAGFDMEANCKRVFGIGKNG